MLDGGGLLAVEYKITLLEPLASFQNHTWVSSFYAPDAHVPDASGDPPTFLIIQNPTP